MELLYSLFHPPPPPPPVIGTSYKRGSLIVSVLDSDMSGRGSSPGEGHCIMFLGKRLASHPGRSKNARSRFMLLKLG